MDDIEAAQNREQLDRDISIANARRAMGLKQSSSLECVECLSPIPEERRKALPGVQVCIDCAEEVELNRRRGIA